MTDQSNDSVLEEVLVLGRDIRERLDGLYTRLGETVDSLNRVQRSLDDGVPGLLMHSFDPSGDLTYLTNDRLRIESRSQVLWVNRKPLTLGDREFILVTILARHALKVAAKGGEGYLHKNDLLEEIDSYGAGALWQDPCREDIDRLVSTLREKLKSIGVSRDLVDTSSKNQIRLSTHPTNIEFAKEIDLRD